MNSSIREITAARRRPASTDFPSIAIGGDLLPVLEQVAKTGKGNFAYNAATGECGDMVAMGVLDPTRVTRHALQNASSVAGLMLTTDAMVAELVEDKPAGGGMGGMGGMDM